MNYDAILDELATMEDRLATINHKLALGATIPRADIALIQVGQPYHLDGTTTYRVDTADPDQLLLILVMPAGKLLDFHDHDCPERGTVVSGKIEVNGATFCRMQQYRFSPYNAHAVRAVHASVILLEFPLPEGRS